MIAGPVRSWIWTLVAALIAAVLALLTIPVPQAIAIMAVDAHPTYAYAGRHCPRAHVLDDGDEGSALPVARSAKSPQHVHSRPISANAF